MSSFRVNLKPPVTNSLIGWWKFNEGLGTIALDSSGYGNNGTLIGSPIWVSGLTRGKSLQFNGSNYVNIPFGKNFTPNAMTISSWFNISSFSSVNPRIIANDHTDSDGKGFQLMINNGGTNGFFDVGCSGGTGTASWTHTISLNTWYHYVGTYNGNSVVAYINGASVGSGSTSGQLIAATNNFSIGYNPSYGGDYVTGTINNIRLYNRALSQNEILILYNSFS